MKKVLPLVICFLLLSLNFRAADIPFDQYRNVLLSDYENYADNQTVKVTLSVSNAGSSVGPGWGIGTIKPINNEGAAAAYEFSCKAASEAGAENVYEFTIAQFKNFAKVDGEYFVDQYGQKGISINVYNGATLISITVGEAITPSAVLDFEDDAIGTAYEGIAWSANDITAVVEANPSGTGNSLHVTSNNWNAYPKFSVNLPDGKTVGDIEKIKFDIYLGTNGSSDQNSYKNIDYFIGGKGASFAADSKTGSANNIITSDATNTWIPKEMTITTSDAALLALNSFDFGMGILVAKADYYLDNIQFIVKGASIPLVKNQTNVFPAEGGIIVNAINAKVAVYGIDGRLVKQTINHGQVISLEKGLYIVKVGDGKSGKVLVK